MTAEKKLLVTSIQSLSVDDGSGLRTTVFLKGCPLKCPWCCNPETQSNSEELFFNREICSSYIGSRFCGDCKGELSFNKSCLFGATNVVGEYMTIKELKRKIIAKSCQNITFSGGEPLVQDENLHSLIKELKDENCSIAIETALSITPTEELVKMVDEWIVDLKLQYPYYTFIPSMIIPQATYRLVIFAELLNNLDWLPWLIKNLKNLSIKYIELLSYHELGKIKYQQLNREFHSFTPPSKLNIEKISFELLKNGIKTKNLYI